jgi:glycyl-tRNA synthetase
MDQQEIFKLPTKAAVLPLVKKTVPEIAHKIVEDLKWDFNVTYDEKDAVGRRYRRQDALGTVLYG